MKLNRKQIRQLIKEEIKNISEQQLLGYPEQVAYGSWHVSLDGGVYTLYLTDEAGDFGIFNMVLDDGHELVQKIKADNWHTGAPK